MTHPQTVEEKPIDPEQARFMARVKLMMALSGVAMLLGIVGYRVFGSGGRVAPTETTVLLPSNSRIAQTALVGNHLVVTIEIPGGGVEIRSFDAQSLRPAGRLRFATEP